MEASAPDRTRLWIWSGRVLIVAFLTACLVTFFTGHWWIIVAAVIVATAASWLLDPNKAFWGPGPAKVMSDPNRRSRYRRTELRFLILAFVGLIVATAIITARTM